MSDLCKASYALEIEIVNNISSRSLELYHRFDISYKSRDITCPKFLQVKLQ